MAKDKGAYGEGVTRFKVRFRAEDKLWIAVIQLCWKVLRFPQDFSRKSQEESPTWWGSECMNKLILGAILPLFVNKSSWEAFIDMKVSYVCMKMNL